jgi:hypothetical protein
MERNKKITYEHSVVSLDLYTLTKAYKAVKMQREDNYFNAVNITSILKIPLTTGVFS